MASEAAARHGVTLAFDAEAATYDATFGRNPVGLVLRHVVQEHLAQLFPPGATVVDLGCGTGEDALLLASRGVQVVGIDPAPGMIERARKKVSDRGTVDRVRFEVAAAEDVALVAGDGAALDGAYSNFGALNCSDLDAVGEGLARVLRPGAGVLISLVGRWPLPALVERALTGRGDGFRRAARVGGRTVPVEYPRRREAQARLGPEFSWDRGYALGVVLPAPAHRAWVEAHPQAFALLAALENGVRRWPGLRDLGDHLVLVGRRR